MNHKMNRTSKVRQTICKYFILYLLDNSTHDTSVPYIPHVRCFTQMKTLIKMLIGVKVPHCLNLQGRTIFF